MRLLVTNTGINLNFFFFIYRIKLVVSEEDVRKAYQRSMDSMARLNRIGARLMHKYNAHGATDVTGFGLLGKFLILFVEYSLSKIFDTVEDFHSSKQLYTKISL